MYKKLVTAINTRRQSQLQFTIVTNLAWHAIILHTQELLILLQEILFVCYEIHCVKPLD